MIPKNAPDWLKNAETENADVELYDNCVMWRGGVWHRGEWYGGEWRGGHWYGGEWRGGVWYGGEWSGSEDRLLFMASLCGIRFNSRGFAKAFRTVRADLSGRHIETFIQPINRVYFENDIPPAGSGTCVAGIHVTSAAKAWTYFCVDPTCRFIEVTFKRKDLLDCDGEKARIRGGYFREVPRPF